MLKFEYELSYDETNVWQAYYLDVNNIDPHGLCQRVHMGVIVENDNGTFTTATISIACMVDNSIEPTIIPIEFEQKDHAAMYVLARDTYEGRSDAIKEARAIMEKLGMGLSKDDFNDITACEIADKHYDTLMELKGTEWEEQVKIFISDMHPNLVDSTDEIIKKLHEIDDWE